MSKQEIINDVSKKIREGYWPGYVHCFPHKRAYRKIDIDLNKEWKNVREHNVYVHIPFCRRKCSFCNLFSCAVNISDNEIELYIDALCKQIDFYGDILGQSKIRSIYFGGGTPSILTATQLEHITKSIYNNFPNYSDDIDPCIECSPDDLSKDYINALKDIGFKRVSVGVQSFSQKALEDVDRRYNSQNIFEIVKCFQEIGLNYNLDLIYGLPNQTEQEVFENVIQAAKLGPQTITVYPLAVRKLTRLENVDKNKIMSMLEKYAIFHKIRNILENEGYVCQTVVRFIKSNKSTYQQQRLEYQGIPTVGVGAGARSYAPTVHYCVPYRITPHKVKEIINAYIDTETDKLQYEGFRFEEEDLKRKFVALSILDPGIDIHAYYEQFSSDIFEDFKEEFDALIEMKMVFVVDDMVILTHKGRQYCDIVVEIFEGEKISNLYKSYIAE